MEERWGRELVRPLTAEWGVGEESKEEQRPWARAGRGRTHMTTCVLTASWEHELDLKVRYGEDVSREIGRASCRERVSSPV